MKPPIRCSWPGDDPLYLAYHDEEWGVPVHDDRRWFEFIILEGAQAGLSWITILRKREQYRLVFDNFDPEIIAQYDACKVEALLADPGIVRNRLKINSTIQNARAFLKLQAEFGSFDKFIRFFVGGAPCQNHLRDSKDIPARSEVSDRLSKELRRRGFNFVGTTICYAFMQATGLVNDHLISCFRHKEVARLGQS